MSNFALLQTECADMPDAAGKTNERTELDVLAGSLQRPVTCGYL
jgi:hypothetical protein